MEHNLFSSEIITRATVGTGGFLASIGLAHLNQWVSLLAGLATLVYMIICIRKATKK